MSETIRAGIVGYGFAGRGFHAHLLTHEPRIKLVAVASRDPGRRRQAESDYGVKAVANLQTMLRNPDVDLVILATPHAVHAEQAVAVMDAGKHCVCDKVMCLTGEEADRMLAARDRNRVLFSVFHNRRWDGDYLTIRQVLESGILGRPRLMEIGVWRYGAPRSWRAQKAAVGTILHDWGAHFIDQMLQLIPGKVVSVNAHAHYDWPELDVESYIGADVVFDGGFICRLELSNRARIGKPHWYVLGEKGALVKEGIDPQEAAMLGGDIRAAREDPANYARILTDIGGGVVAESRPETLAGDWTAYYRNIAEVLLDKADLIVQPEEAKRGVLLLEGVQQSIAQARSVTFRKPL